MAEGRAPYAPEYRRRMVEPVRAAERLVEWPWDPQDGESKRAFRRA